MFLSLFRSSKGQRGARFFGGVCGMVAGSAISHLIITGACTRLRRKINVVAQDQVGSLARTDTGSEVHAARTTRAISSGNAGIGRDLSDLDDLLASNRLSLPCYGMKSSGSFSTSPPVSRTAHREIVNDALREGVHHAR
jgi:hypothetical protein